MLLWRDDFRVWGSCTILIVISFIVVMRRGQLIAIVFSRVTLRVLVVMMFFRKIVCAAVRCFNAFQNASLRRCQDSQV